MLSGENKADGRNYSEDANDDLPCMWRQTAAATGIIYIFQMHFLSTRAMQNYMQIQAEPIY